MQKVVIFYKEDFEMMQQTPWSDEYLPLEQKTAGRPKGKEDVVYQKKSVSSKWIVALLVVGLVFSFAVMTGVTVYSM